MRTLVSFNVRFFFSYLRNVGVYIFLFLFLWYFNFVNIIIILWNYGLALWSFSLMIVFTPYFIFGQFFFETHQTYHGWEVHLLNKILYIRDIELHQ